MLTNTKLDKWMRVQLDRRFFIYSSFHTFFLLCPNEVDTHCISIREFGKIMLEWIRTLYIFRRYHVIMKRILLSLLKTKLEMMAIELIVRLRNYFYYHIHSQYLVCILFFFTIIFFRIFHKMCKGTKSEWVIKHESNVHRMNIADVYFMLHIGVIKHT